MLEKEKLIIGKNILLISPEPWCHVFVSKHHYAIHLGKRGNNVYFLNPPSNRKEVAETTYDNVCQVNYVGFLQGLRFLPPLIQKFYIRKVYRQLEVLCNVTFDVVWSFDNSVFYDFSALSDNVLKISHIVDLNQGFQTAKAAATADVCFCTTNFIKKILLKYNKEVLRINHGYAPNLHEGEFQLSIQNNNIKVGYAGNLDISYIDWKLMLKIVKSKRQVQFYFAGPLINQNIKQSLKECENVIYLDKLNKDALELFYRKMDLLILVYKADQYKKQLANPHKMMEYLASGKMIVATQTAEYKQLEEEGLFLMSNENQEFPRLFQSAVENIAYWNSEEKQQARQAYALENTYDKQINRIEKYIANVYPY